VCAAPCLTLAPARLLGKVKGLVTGDKLVSSEFLYSYCRWREGKLTLTAPVSGGWAESGSCGCREYV